MGHRFRCIVCASLPRGFVFDSDTGACPKCNRKGFPAVQPLVDVHFMVLHEHGPITGQWGRQYVACEPRRDALAKHPEDMYAATDDPRAVTCPSCKGTKQFKELAKLFPEIALADAAPELEAARQAAFEQHLKDCGCP